MMPTDIVDRVAALLRDPLFWIATVIFGLIVTILGNYLTRVFDGLFASFRLSRRRKIEVTERAVIAGGNHLLKHPTERIDVQLDVLFYSQRQVLWSAWFVVALVMAVFGAVALRSVVSRYVVLALLLLGLFAWLNVGVYSLRERRARRVLEAHRRLVATPSYSEVMDATLTETNSADGV